VCSAPISVQPNAVGYEYARLTNDGYSWLWSFLNITPSSGLQVIDAAGDTINANRAYCALSPDAAYTLMSTPTITAGVSDGQFLTCTNTSATYSITLQDEVNRPGSQLRLGGSNLTVAPRGSFSVVWNTTVGAWVRTDTPGSASAGLADPGANGIVKRTTANTTAAATPGIDYVVPTGNVATATALAVNGTNCSSGSYARGVDAAGNAEDCTSVSSTSRAIYAHNNSAAQITASADGITPTVHYLALTGSQSSNSSENARSTVIPVPGTLSRLYILNGTSPQSSSGPLTCSVRVNGVIPAGTLTITFTNSDGSNAVKSDLVNTVAVAAGDKVALRCENLATSSSTAIASHSMVFTF
jgi:hypothetical protein